MRPSYRAEHRASILPLKITEQELLSIGDMLDNSRAYLAICLTNSLYLFVLFISVPKLMVDGTKIINKKRGFIEGESSSCFWGFASWIKGE